MQAQNTGAPAAKPGIAKSFSIQPQPGRLKLGGSNAFAAASSPAYVKVLILFSCYSAHSQTLAGAQACIRC